MNPLSELAWHLEDYRAADVDPPARCVSNPDKTEGEMMNEDELEEFIKDSTATLRILADKKSPRYDDIRAIFVADLAYLASVGQISDDDYNELTHPDNLQFHAEI
ncbi:hypothetical protein HJC99_04870 [Candidatus Saccharibacteria bacterium]|nr:hypothetical protein [Candidatus Saccharibacteria bacterium]